uniref:Uncharacterized protein n=1 Tax=Hyaloperonospora arabidopsidis (strain Emoy2) TaxID=559515 RepID=M4BHY4_HYAAE
MDDKLFTTNAIVEAYIETVTDLSKKKGSEGEILVSVAISAPKIYVPQDEETLKNPRRTLYVWNDRIKTKGNTKPFRLDGKHRGDKRCEVQKINVFCPSAMLDDEELSNYSGDFRVEALVCGQLVEFRICSSG